MNPLETFISEQNLDPQEAMNRLQEHGIVSDHCIWADSVHKDDWQVAIAFLRPVPKKGQP